MSQIPTSHLALRVCSGKPDQTTSRWRSARESRLDRFAEYERIFRDANWPWELVDVEPLLDGRAAVIHYLGPHHVDITELRARFRVECDIDVVLEPVGIDLDLDGEDDANEDEAAGGGCGSCGCAPGGGCGSGATNGERAAPSEHAETAASACATTAHSGCSSCGISRLMAERKRAPV